MFTPPVIKTLQADVHTIVTLMGNALCLNQPLSSSLTHAIKFVSLVNSVSKANVYEAKLLCGSDSLRGGATTCSHPRESSGAVGPALFTCPRHVPNTAFPRLAP